MRAPELRHYVLDDGRLHRADPVALTAPNFVTWLRHPWPEVSEWTAQIARSTLKTWQEGYKGWDSEFTLPTRHCTAHPDLWQVTSAGSDPNAHDSYFLIRARPPFRFSMVAVSDRPWPDRTEDDPGIDTAPGIFDK